VSLLIKYTSECECGGTLSSRTLDLSQNPGGEVEVDLDMLGEMVIECSECGRKVFVPDLSDYMEEVEA
jgi:DNA-directed RNA polymerase subunit RPC12/RpoP